MPQTMPSAILTRLHVDFHIPLVYHNPMFQGALADLGHVLAHKTIANILKQHGIEPATRRDVKSPACHNTFTPKNVFPI